MVGLGAATLGGEKSSILEMFPEIKADGGETQNGRHLHSLNSSKLVNALMSGYFFCLVN